MSFIGIRDLMSQLDLSEQLAYEKERADKAEAQIERIKMEGKGYEQMLEEEAQRKEVEIRKLKEEAILKEKTFKANKVELAQLQTQNAALKEQLATAQNGSRGVDPQQLAQKQAECAQLKQRVQELGKELLLERQKVSRQEEEVSRQEEAQQLQVDKWNKKERAWREDLEMAKSLADELKKYNAILNEKLAYYTKPESLQKQPQRKEEELERADSKKLIKTPRQSIERQQYQAKIKQLQQQCRNLEDSLKKTEALLKESRLKVQSLTQDNQSLRQKLKSSINNSPPLQVSSLSHSSPLVVKESSFSSPQVAKEGQSAEDQAENQGSLTYSCLLLTKPHYISPFLEVYEDKNTVQIYKSTRAGCYQRSMGFYRHKFDALSYEQEQIIEPIVRSILESQECSHHSVILFGAKRSCKKELLSKILVRLKDFLIHKLQNCHEAEALYLKRSQEEARNSSEHATDKNAVVEVINKVVALGYRNEKGKERMLPASSPKKNQAKPKVRYFSFQADQFRLELASSSFTGISFRPSVSPTALLNHILYSRLPDVLQSSRAHQHLVLTLNPIVDLYQQCRNTLSATFCRGQTRHQDTTNQRASPIRGQLNDLAKRRFDSIQREQEQTQLRSRKFQEQCLFYRAKFEQLEVRLKHLLNTHSGQTSYLKKSPVTLSYEKLLKFVHAVQARSAVALPRFASMALKSGNIYIDKDNSSVDAL